MLSICTSPKQTANRQYATHIIIEQTTAEMIGLIFMHKRLCVQCPSNAVGMHMRVYFKTLGIMSSLSSGTCLYKRRRLSAQMIRLLTPLATITASMPINLVVVKSIKSIDAEPIR